MGKDEFDIHDYKWISHNRINIHRKAKTCSGGVGILINKYMYETFNFTILDNSYGGNIVDYMVF